VSFGLGDRCNVGFLACAQGKHAAEGVFVLMLMLMLMLMFTTRPQMRPLSWCGRMAVVNGPDT